MPRLQRSSLPAPPAIADHWALFLDVDGTLLEFAQEPDAVVVPVSLVERLRALQRLGAQTVVVAVWIIVNSAGWLHFDVYPFILLNLAFSLQAAYAAPLILLAQTRQAARDKMHAEADAQHREALAVANEQRQLIAAQNATQMLELLEQNTRLTELTKQLTERIEALTVEMHERIRHGLPPSEVQPPGTSTQARAQTPP